MRFSGKKATFGRHETFPLRYGWLTKGVQELLLDRHVFEAEDATVRLGVGKNMVNSIRYWLRAARIITKERKGWQLTPVGALVFDDDGYDQYLEDEGTLWLIHWLIVSNPELATSWWWFFNRFHKPEFSSAEVGAALLDFAMSDISGKFSAATVKNDAAVLLRMYDRSTGNKRIPVEEGLDSPLSLLKLISAIPGTKKYQSRPAMRKDLPLGVFGFAAAEVFAESGLRQIPIEELMYGLPELPALGAVFRLTESALLTNIERMVPLVPEVFDVRETAGIHQLYLLRDVRPLEFLEYHYSETAGEAAA